ncbi:MAG TPA: hypothetical protein VF006_22890 [Longimicrobium sp.]
MSRTLESPPAAVHQIPAPPPPAPARREPLWRAMIPGLSTGVAAAAVLVTAWFIGTAYDVRMPGGLRPEQVIAAPLEPAAPSALRARAAVLVRRGDSIEAAALAGALPADGVKAAREQAELYGEWAAQLDARAHAAETAAATREARRILWIYSLTLDLIVCAAAALVALGLVVRALVRLRRERVVSGGLAAGVLAVDGALGVAVAAFFVRVWYDYRTEPFQLVGAAAGESVLRMVRFDDGLHVGTCTLLVAGCVMLLAVPRLLASHPADGHPPTPAAAARDARLVAEALRIARCVLYVGAAMVVVYVATVSAVFQWTLAYVDAGRPALLQGVEALTQSAVTARSLIASGLLVAIYGPTVLTLRMMANRLAARALPDASLPAREEWMQAQGLSSSNPSQHIKTVAAILAPIVTGPIAGALQGVLG